MPSVTAKRKCPDLIFEKPRFDAYKLSTRRSCFPEELRREDEAACAGYGFQSGTNAFASCLQKESLARVTGLRHLRIGVGATGAGAGSGGRIGLDRRLWPGGLSDLNILGDHPEHCHECHPGIGEA